jgi:Domain of unknown function (DUF3819)
VQISEVKPSDTLSDRKREMGPSNPDFAVDKAAIAAATATAVAKAEVAAAASAQQPGGLPLRLPEPAAVAAEAAAIQCSSALPLGMHHLAGGSFWLMRCMCNCAPILACTTCRGTALVHEVCTACCVSILSPQGLLIASAPTSLSTCTLTFAPSLCAPPAAAALMDQGVFANVFNNAVVNPNLGPLIDRLQLRRIVPVAVDRAIHEIIMPVVERSVTIACMTTQELILKDFAMEPEVELVRQVRAGTRI